MISRLKFSDKYAVLTMKAAKMSTLSGIPPLAGESNSAKISPIAIAKCSLCGEKVKIGTKPWIGQEVTCPACEATLKVVTLQPLSIDWPYDDDGYYYDDDNEEEEYEFDEDDQREAIVRQSVVY